MQQAEKWIFDGITMQDIDAARNDLHNWRAWALDDPNHLGYPSRASFARYYVAGKAFDEAPKECVDVGRAERTEKIVVKVGLSDFDAHRLLVAAYLHSKPAKALAKQFHTNIPEIRRRLRNAEIAYCKICLDMR